MARAHNGLCSSYLSQKVSLHVALNNGRERERFECVLLLSAYFMAKQIELAVKRYHQLS